MRRAGVFGWGVVAPRSPDVDAFAANLARAESWLQPFHGFGPDNFLVGTPEFSFADYRGWIDARFPPNRFRQLAEKIAEPTLYAVGAFIQALGQNPGIEEELARLGTRARVYVGTEIGAIGTLADATRALDRAQRRWDRFWAKRDATVSKPLSELRGTHVAGGSVLWIVGDLEHMRARGFRPLGMEPVAVGVSSDADHIITPSVEGPSAAIGEALAAAGVAPQDIATWDLHATATPGDYREVETLRTVLPASVLVTARKGTLGHGMGAGGGWELTAQYLGYERGRLYPTPLARAELNPEIAALHDLFVFDEPCAVSPVGAAGKLSMGIGGVNACVISRPWA